MTRKNNPNAPRRKYALLKWVRNFNAKNPGRTIATPDGFDPETEVVGDPAREFLRAMQRVAGLSTTGQFDHATMVKLLPPGIRGEVMARAHAEVGEHEWPPGSNMGEIVEYLHSVGLGGGYPWCAAFATWVLKKEGFKHFPPNPASADSWGKWAKSKGCTKPVRNSMRGDLWCWEWGNNDGMLDHIGFVDEGVKGTQAWYLDGNVGAYGGSVTDAARSVSAVAVTIDLVRLRALK